ncbi:pilus assembly protein [bacterium]|nr:pilus assembly protein [bacterium]
MGLNKKNTGVRAVAVVEMALLLPLLIVMLMGLLEYGWLFTKAHQITNIARNAARVAVLPDSTNGDVVSAVATQMAQVGMAGKYTMTMIPSDVSSVASGQALQVSLSAPYTGISLFNCALIPAPDALRAAVTMAKEGP